MKQVRLDIFEVNTVNNSVIIEDEFFKVLFCRDGATDRSTGVWTRISWRLRGSCGPLNITLIKADTPAKVQQVKLIQQLNVALTSTEDPLIIAVAAQPEENVRLCRRSSYSGGESRSLQS
jgi:hypothetical protein